MVPMLTFQSQHSRQCKTENGWQGVPRANRTFRRRSPGVNFEQPATEPNNPAIHGLSNDPHDTDHAQPGISDATHPSYDPRLFEEEPPARRRSVAPGREETAREPLSQALQSSNERPIGRPVDTRERVDLPEMADEFQEMLADRLFEGTPSASSLNSDEFRRYFTPPKFGIRFTSPDYRPRTANPGGAASIEGRPSTSPSRPPVPSFWNQSPSPMTQVPGVQARAGAGARYVATEGSSNRESHGADERENEGEGDQGLVAGGGAGGDDPSDGEGNRDRNSGASTSSSDSSGSGSDNSTDPSKKPPSNVNQTKPRPQDYRTPSAGPTESSLTGSTLDPPPRPRRTPSPSPVQHRLSPQPPPPNPFLTNPVPLNRRPSRITTLIAQETHPRNEDTAHPTPAFIPPRDFIPGSPPTDTRPFIRPPVIVHQDVQSPEADSAQEANTPTTPPGPDIRDENDSPRVALNRRTNPPGTGREGERVPLGEVRVEDVTEPVADMSTSTTSSSLSSARSSVTWPMTGSSLSTARTSVTWPEGVAPLVAGGASNAAQAGNIRAVEGVWAGRLRERRATVVPIGGSRGGARDGARGGRKR